MNDIPPLVQHQRLAGPCQVSIERLFAEVRHHLPSRWNATVSICPRRGRGLLPRVENMIAARRRAGTVNHIVGDVHYLALSLPASGLILTIHDCATLNRLRGVAREAFRQLWFVRPLQRAQFVTTISKVMRDELVRQFGELATKVRVIPNCVRSEFAFSRGEFNRGKPVILQVGTGTNKNLERVALALKGVECRLDIVGPISVAQAKVLHECQTDYREMGTVTDGELLMLYQQCDMVVFASTYEGFGLPILEAQGIGRPLVTSNFGAMSEVAGSGAMLVDPFDVQSIRTGVLELLRSEKLRAQLVDDGVRNLTRFAPSAVAAAYAQVYDEALEATTSFRKGC